jgi:23S rRNA pseudouridine955/2504/2580 synthase
MQKIRRTRKPARTTPVAAPRAARPAKPAAKSRAAAPTAGSRRSAAKPDAPSSAAGRAGRPQRPVERPAESRAAPAEAPAAAPTQAPSETPRRSAQVSYVEAGEGEQGQRIDNFLARILKDLPRSLIYRILRTGEVRVNGGRVKPEHRLARGDRIRLPPLQRPSPDAQQAAAKAPSKSLREFVTSAVIYEDRDLIVVNKPPGVAVHGGSGLNFGVIEALRAAYPQWQELELVHRLDRDTSGCLLVAKRRAALRELHALLRERRMEKRYLALVVGRWPFGAKTIELPLQTNVRQGGERVVRVHAQGQEASTRFEPLAHFGRLATLLDVSLGTGRTHQIRVHTAHAGHPIAGDDKYGDRERDARLKPYGLQRMFLHAHALTFTRTGMQQPFTITAPLPPELQSVLERLQAGSS